MITAGAISISKMMTLNHSLQVLYMSRNSIGDDGISAISTELGNCKVNELYVRECGITFTGAKSLAAALSSNLTIRELWLLDNPITVDGAQLIVEAAFHNKVCHNVFLDDKYINDEVKKMLDILRQKVKIIAMLCDVAS